MTTHAQQNCVEERKEEEGKKKCSLFKVEEKKTGGNGGSKARGSPRAQDAVNNPFFFFFFSSVFCIFQFFSFDWLLSSSPDNRHRQVTPTNTCKTFSFVWFSNYCLKMKLHEE